MAEAVGRTPNATRLQLRKLGLSYRDTRGERAKEVLRTWTPERLEELRGLVAEFSAREVAQYYGLTEKALRNVLYRYGISGRGRSRELDPVECEARKGSAKARWEAKYPPEGPWECYQCYETKPLTEFPEYANSGHVCYRCLHLSRVERTYGISRERYLVMLDEQDGKCGVCRRPEWRTHPKTGRVYMLSVDHDHGCCPGKKSCGKCVRGLLCARCNNVLGHAEDEGVLGGLQKYLTRYADTSVADVTP